MVVIDILFVLRAGAMILLALGSGLVLHLISRADAEEPAAPPASRTVPAPKPETLRRAA